MGPDGAARESEISDLRSQISDPKSAAVASAPVCVSLDLIRVTPYPDNVLVVDGNDMPVPTAAADQDGNGGEP